MREVIAIAVSSYDELMADADFLAEIGGQPGISQMAEMMLAGFTQNRGLEGLDKSRPWGGVIRTDGVAFVPLIFLPVSDVGQLLDSLSGVTGPAEDNGGVYKVSAGTFPVFVKQEGNWAFIGQDPSKLQNLPADPLALLGSLDEDYDVGIRLFVNRVPQQYRAQALMFMQMGMGAAMQRQPDENDAEFQLRRQLMEAQMGQMQRMINELEQLTIGLAIDAAQEVVYLDAEVRAVEGSQFAEQIAASAEVKTKYSGVLRPDAAVSFNATSKVMPEDIQQMSTMVEPFRAGMMQAIDEETDIPNEEMRTQLKALAGSVFDLYVDTVKTGLIDAAGSLTLEPGGLALVVGGHVADGARVEEILREAVTVAESDPNFPGFNFNAETHGGISLHTMSVPVPADEAEARQIIGDTLEVAVGTGQTTAYLAIGSESLTVIKEVIDAADQAPPADLPPVQFVVAMTPIFEFASKIEDDEVVSQVAEMLSSMQGNDRILITARNIERGQSIRYMVEQGVLKAIGEAVKASK